MNIKANKLSIAIALQLFGVSIFAADLPYPENIPESLVTNYYFNLQWNDPKARPAKLFTIGIYRELELISIKAKKYGVQVDTEWTHAFSTDKKLTGIRRDRYMSGYMTPRDAKEFETEWKRHIAVIGKPVAIAEADEKEKIRIRNIVAKESAEHQEQMRQLNEKMLQEVSEDLERERLEQTITKTQLENQKMMKELEESKNENADTKERMRLLEEELRMLREEIKKMNN